MITTKYFFLCLIISQTICQDIRSIYLSQMIDTKYECNSSGCSSSTMALSSNLLNCQIACLNNEQCRTVTFDSISNQCEIFIDIPSQYGTLLTHINIITMIAIDERQLSAPMRSSTITSTTSTSTSSHTTTSTSTSSITTITAVLNPCALGNPLWNTSGITIIGSGLIQNVVGEYRDSNNTFYIADESSSVIWKLLSNSTVPTVALGILSSIGSNSSRLNYPQDVYIDKNGNIYVVDLYNYRIQKYINGSRNGITISGTTTTSGSTLYQLNCPRSFAFDETDTYMYITDSNNHRIMRYLTNSTSGTSGTIVAGGSQGNTNSTLNNPWGIAYVPSLTNDFFITNNNGHSIMRWTPGASSGDFIAATPGVSGSDSTHLWNPTFIKIDNYLNVYVADTNNHRIQMFCANTQVGITIAGTGISGNSATQLSYPRGIVFDADMNMYIADFANYRIQKFMKL